MKDLQVKGFKASGISAGLKKGGKKDLGLIFSEVPAKVAGVFTRNRVQAAPVRLTMERIGSGVCQAIMANSGNANCCTGVRGTSDARRMTALAGSALGIAEDMVLVASTGVIGEFLQMQKIEAAVPSLIEALDARGFSALAEAIMTTDTVAKTVSIKSTMDGCPFALTGVAKGAGMIRPQMATMLCFVCTDLDISAENLRQSLVSATERTFNRITVDGDTSTNDTVLIMANGQSGISVQSTAHKEQFQKILDETLLDLAKQLIRDAEGVTKLVGIKVCGAASDADADKVAVTIAHSPLVKTAFFGEDANWGRVVAAIGRAGADIDPDKIDLFFDDVQMVRSGLGCGKAAESQATAVLKKPEFELRVDLNLATGSAEILTCDFSVEYVRINADYRS